MIARLRQQADVLNGELRELRNELALARGTLIEGNRSDLVHVNEHLTITALHADRIATKAIEGIGELIQASQHDVLTATPNRALALLRMQQAIKMAQDSGTKLAVIFIDIDNFKLINDSLGHAVGDQVLIMVARRLESVVRPSDLVSRFGGEEFLVVLGQLSDTELASVKSESILAALSNPNKFGVCVSASLGIALFPEDGTQLDELIAQADAAMYRAKRAGGGRYEFHSDAHAMPAPPDTGAPFLRGMLDLREANEELVLAAMASRQLEEQARRSCREQDAFIATVVHELRNPLTPIQIAAGLLVNRRGGELSLERLQEIIEGQVHQMTRIINDLIDRSGQHAPEFHLVKTQLDLSSVVHNCVQSWRTVMMQRQQQLLFDPPGEKILINGDSERVTQILDNLLGNATKYTGSLGTIELALRSSDDYASVTITDNGAGISSAALPHIFDLFVRQDRNRTDGIRGQGIGLAVVRDLMAAHGGTVGCTSAGLGRGSEFVITFPKEQL